MAIGELREQILDLGQSFMERDRGEQESRSRGPLDSPASLAERLDQHEILLHRRVEHPPVGMSIHARTTSLAAFSPLHRDVATERLDKVRRFDERACTEESVTSRVGEIRMKGMNRVMDV